MAYLESHSNECPIDAHKGPKSHPNTFIRRNVSQIIIKCPRECKLVKELSGNIMNREGCPWTGKILSLNVRYVHFLPLFPRPVSPTKKNKQKTGIYRSTLPKIAN